MNHPRTIAHDFHPKLPWGASIDRRSPAFQAWLDSDRRYRTGFVPSPNRSECYTTNATFPTCRHPKVYRAYHRGVPSRFAETVAKLAIDLDRNPRSKSGSVPGFGCSQDRSHGESDHRSTSSEPPRGRTAICKSELDCSFPELDSSGSWGSLRCFLGHAPLEESIEESLDIST